MKKIKIIYESFEDWVSGILLVSGLLVMFHAVVLRYAFHASTTWQNEISVYFVVWGALIGAAVTIRDGKHAKMDWVYMLFPGKIKRYVGIFSNSVVVVFLGLMVFYGSILVFQRFVSGQNSMNGIPLWIPYLIIPLSAFMMGIRVLRELLRLFKPNSEIEEDAASRGGIR
ncbi:MAG: TRAP transporter small permease [Dehalobacterium sp.]